MIFFQLFLIFSKIGIVGFGGGYAMLSPASLSRYTIWIPLVAAILIYFFDVSPVYIILIAGRCQPCA